VSLLMNWEPWFLKINPNGRIPAIEDRSTNPPAPIFESGAILQYLVDKYDKEGKASYARETHPKEYYEQLSWLFFQNAGVGPMQGQANRTYFLRHFEHSIDTG
jgi:glutathione S-transferase